MNTKQFNIRAKQLKQYSLNLKRNITLQGSGRNNQKQSNLPSLIKGQKQLQKTILSNNPQQDLPSQKSLSQFQRLTIYNDQLKKSLRNLELKIIKKKQRHIIHDLSKRRLQVMNGSSKPQPLNTFIFITQIQIVQSLQKICNQLASQSQSEHLKQYSVFVHQKQNFSKNSKCFSQLSKKYEVDQSWNENNKNFKGQQYQFQDSTQYQKGFIQIIFLDLNAKEFCRLKCKDIIQSSIDCFANFLKFQGYSSFEKIGIKNRQMQKQLRTFIMEFKSSKHFTLWQTFLKELSKVYSNYKNKNIQLYPPSKVKPNTSITNHNKKQKRLTVLFNLPSNQGDGYFTQDKFIQTKNTINIKQESLEVKPQQNKVIPNQEAIHQNQKKDQTNEQIIEQKKLSDKNVIEPDQVQLKNLILLKKKKKKKKKTLSQSSGSISPKITNRIEEKYKLLISSSDKKANIYWMDQSKSNFKATEIISEDKSQTLATEGYSQQQLIVNRPMKMSLAQKNEINKTRNKNKSSYQNANKNITQTNNSEEFYNNSPSNASQDVKSPIINSLKIKRNQNTSQHDQKVQRHAKLKEYTQSLLDSQIHQKNNKNCDSSTYTVSTSKRKSNKKELKLIVEKQAQIVRQIHRKKSLEENNSNTESEVGRSSSFITSSRIMDSSNFIKSSRMITNNQRSRNISQIKDKKYQNSESFESASNESSESSISSSDMSEENKIRMEQLKNGIVLWKYSENGWKPHEKKLFIDRNQLQLCYCSITNSLDQKKFFIHDIIKVQYESFGKGITAHCKANIDRGRCLMITYRANKENSEKALEFMVSRTQPIYKLKSFANKLNNFIKTQKLSREQYE